VVCPDCGAWLEPGRIAAEINTALRIRQSHHWNGGLVPAVALMDINAGMNNVSRVYM
jgi:hypothetical protein